MDPEFPLPPDREIVYIDIMLERLKAEPTYPSNYLVNREIELTIRREELTKFIGSTGLEEQG